MASALRAKARQIYGKGPLPTKDAPPAFGSAEGALPGFGVPVVHAAGGHAHEGYGARGAKFLAAVGALLPDLGLGHGKPLAGPDHLGPSEYTGRGHGPQQVDLVLHAEHVLAFAEQAERGEASRVVDQRPDEAGVQEIVLLSEFGPEGQFDLAETGLQAAQPGPDVGHEGLAPEQGHGAFAEVGIGGIDDGGGLQVHRRAKIGRGPRVLRRRVRGVGNASITRGAREDTVRRPAQRPA